MRPVGLALNFPAPPLCWPGRGLLALSSVHPGKNGFARCLRTARRRGRGRAAGGYASRQHGRGGASPGCRRRLTLPLVAPRVPKDADTNSSSRIWSDSTGTSSLVDPVAWCRWHQRMIFRVMSPYGLWSNAHAHLVERKTLAERTRGTVQGAEDRETISSKEFEIWLCYYFYGVYRKQLVQMNLKFQ